MNRRFQFSLKTLFITTAASADAIELWLWHAPFGIWMFVGIMSVIIYNAVAETVAGR